MKLQIMQTVMQSAANAFIRWLNSPSDSSHQQSAAQRAAQEAKWKKEQAEWHAEVAHQIAKLNKEYDSQQKQQFEKKKQEIESGLKGMGDDGGESQSEALRQLRCQASLLAEAANTPDLKEAEDLNMHANAPNLDSDCPQAAMPEPPEVSGGQVQMEIYQTVVSEINKRLPLIKQARVKQHKAAAKLAEDKKKVEELKAKQKTAKTPEQQQSTDDLTAAAMKELLADTDLKKKADAGVKKLELEVDALKDYARTASAPNGGSKNKGATP